MSPYPVSADTACHHLHLGIDEMLTCSSFEVHIRHPKQSIFQANAQWGVISCNKRSTLAQGMTLFVAEQHCGSTACALQAEGPPHNLMR